MHVFGPQARCKTQHTLLSPSFSCRGRTHLAQRTACKQRAQPCGRCRRQMTHAAAPAVLPCAADAEADADVHTAAPALACPVVAVVHVSGDTGCVWDALGAPAAAVHAHLRRASDANPGRSRASTARELPPGGRHGGRTRRLSAAGRGARAAAAAECGRAHVGGGARCGAPAARTLEPGRRGGCAGVAQRRDRRTRVPTRPWGTRSRASCSRRALPQAG
jgi:hypothetical protein